MLLVVVSLNGQIPFNNILVLLALNHDIDASRSF